MSRSQDAARARDIIRRRQRQEEDNDRIFDTSINSLRDHPGTLPTPRQPNRSPSRSQPIPVRITVSERTHSSENTPQIYSVPTTETYGDESLVLRQVAMPTPHRRNNTAPNVLQRPPSKEPEDVPSIPISHAMLSNGAQSGPGSDVRRHFRQTNSAGRTTKGDFQNNHEIANVCVQTVNIAQRSAFERRPPLALELWQRIAEQGGASRRSSNIALRMSPSYQHLKLLHILQSIQTIRQVQFSPSTSLAADLFVDSWDGCSDLPMSSRKGALRDGRYRSIDPVRATVAVLPHFPPVLSNKKTRLPRRSDVGFANASPDEILVKQKEIAHETEWEEASPRLVVLVTSDDLGRAVQDSDVIGSDGSSCCHEHLNFNGGGLEYIPFAGRELIQAKERNARHFGQPCCPPRLTRFLSPDRNSMLAPPLDAMYSPSKGWKPRPFHDRPAGMQYCLVSPQSVTFGSVDVEPLICSLALYTLPSTPTPASTAVPLAVFGKMSEEFWFPAGDWTGKFAVDDARREDGSIDSSLLASGMKRRSKGIFSFDPLALNGGYRSLFIVLQVFRLAHVSAVPPYNQVHGSEQSRSDACDDAKMAATKMFQQFGTQLQSPHCFGVAPLYRDEEEVERTSSMKWPDGEFRHMSLHRHPATPESQESFVSRLAALVLKKGKNKEQSKACENKVIISDLSVSSASESSKKKNVVSRLFKMAPKQSFSDEFLKLDNGEHDSFDECVGDCKLLVSSLESDFIQAMLAAPAVRADTVVRDDRLPRLLVDVSGDLAVLLDPTLHSQSSKVSAHLRKRSSLLRLPLSGDPAGYARNPEFREVNYLPARSEKHYDSDAGLSYRSLTNLLYLYPRLLRQTANGPNILGGSLFTIRIQAFQSQSGTNIDSSSSVTLNAFHNPAAWAGPILLDQIFTKTLGPAAHGDDAILELPMRDEIKLRLPPVLDGSYSLRFELYTFTPDTLLLVADAVIPLSSSLSRDSGRVATIIPNGNHRLKLGEFQLQLETRLLSAIHVGDPSVATLLRDYPCDKSEVEDGGLTGSSMRYSHRALDTTLLCDASPGSVACHFETLLYMHLSNLLNCEDSAAKEMRNSPAFIRDNMISFFEVCRKVKSRFLGSGSGNRHDLLRAFIKKQIDLFDEQYLALSSVSVSHSSDRFEVEADSASEVHADETQDENKFEGSDEMNDVGAVRIRSISEQLGYRGSRSAPSPRAPFSRVAFGASKTDRMKIEAELQGQKGLISHFFDDDDTIATTPTLQTLTTNTHGEKGDDSKPLHPLGNGRHASDASSDNSIVRSASAGSHANEASGHRPTGSAEFAQRVRTVAQVMLAPCVGPSLSSILSKSNSPQASAKMDVKRWGIEKQASHGIQVETLYKCLPDSDAEQDEVGSSFDTTAGYKTGSHHRDRPDVPSFKFSVKSKTGRDLPVCCGEYLYETIFLLWLSAWLDHVETCLLEPPRPSNESRAQLSTFPIPDQNQPSASQPSIFSYFANMDILLPICLKSIVLRFSVEVLPFSPLTTKVMVDESHTAVLEPFVEMLARGLLGQALAGLGSQESRDKALIRALSSSEVVLDFLVGLIDVLHPEHMHELLQKFFKTLRDGETEHLMGIGTSNIDFEWSEESLHRVRFSRQLRLRAVEVLAVLPSFLALNYPPRYPSVAKPFQSRIPTWNEQYIEIRDSTSKQATQHTVPSDNAERLPRCRWLAEMILSEALSICSLSCEAVVAEAIAHIEVTCSNVSKKVSVVPSSLKKRPGADLKRHDLLMLQSLAIHAISCAYELILRRHAMDRRFQKDSCRERIAGLFASVILDKSLSSSRWLARMEATHKVRSIWLLCFVYILQEAPDCMIRDHVRSLCSPENIQIHRFIRLLRLSSSTFQGFVDLPKHANFPSQIDQGLSPWLLQESFNTVVAATITVVDECSQILVGTPDEYDKLMAGILDLLLHLLTTPQSSVTHLRAVGGALQALEKFGVQNFLDTAGSSLQHWIRVILSLMNSTSLSVRSISVDFVVSLLGSTFDVTGDIGFIALVAVTVLPEVAAREIALCSVNGLIATSDDVARALWPLRRSLADIEDSNPLDDDRIDPHLPPILATFCRACQAALDGVLTELLLRGDNTTIVGTKVLRSAESDLAFNSDQESLFETATFFDPESAPMQRVRWLMTLSRLHEAKQQWVEAAEALMLCTSAITAAMPHLKQVWRPSRYILWSDSRRSLWLETVGEDLGYPDRGNTQVMEFAEQFLEPTEFGGTSWQASATGKLRQPSLSSMSLLLGQMVRGAVKFYQIEGMDEIAQTRLESLLKSIMEIIEFHKSHIPAGSVARKRHMEDEASLRRVLASVSGELSKVTEKLLERVQSERTDFGVASKTLKTYAPCRFLVLQLSGKRTARFQESTSLPTFLDFESPCICRLPIDLTGPVSTTELRDRFVRPLVAALSKESGSESVVLVTDPSADVVVDESKVYLHAYLLDSTPTSADGRIGVQTKSFFYRKLVNDGTAERSILVEMKVAHSFPCALSRQRAVLTTEIGFLAMS